MVSVMLLLNSLETKKTNPGQDTVIETAILGPEKLANGSSISCVTFDSHVTRTS